MLKQLSTKREKLLLVADLVERGLQGQELGFDMANFKAERHCGTVSCIAGHVMAYFVPDEYKEIASGPAPQYGQFEVADRAAEILGLSDDEAHRLFVCWAEPGTRQHAAAVIRHFAETGVVDWSVGTE